MYTLLCIICNCFIKSTHKFFSFVNCDLTVKSSHLENKPSKHVYVDKLFFIVRVIFCLKTSKIGCLAGVGINNYKENISCRHFLLQTKNICGSGRQLGQRDLLSFLLVLFVHGYEVDCDLISDLVTNCLAVSNQSLRLWYMSLGGRQSL